MCRLREKRYKNKNKWTNIYLTDKQFKAITLLRISFIMNTAYAVWQIICGVYYLSYWFLTLGCYNTLLSVIRVFLIRSQKKDNITGKKMYLICGIMLLFMNFTILGIVVLIVEGMHNVTPYAGYLIYVVALYTFYKIISAIMNAVKPGESGIITIVSKGISFVAAVVSVLSLAIVMIIQFNGGGEFLKVMTISLGTVAAVIITVVAVKMIVAASRMR